jgi:hypothetical protein
MAKVCRNPLNAKANTIQQLGHPNGTDLPRPRHETEPEETKLEEAHPQARVPLMLILELQQES